MKRNRVIILAMRRMLAMNRQAKATSHICKMAEFSSVGRTVIVDMPTTINRLVLQSTLFSGKLSLLTDGAEVDDDGT